MPSRRPQTSPWDLIPVDETVVSSLAASAGVSEIVARVLVARGIETQAQAQHFLTPDLDRDWRDPETLTGMPECADAVADAVRAGSRIVVFGDFDVDGLTAATIAGRGLAALGADVMATVPHRFREGYGLSAEAVGRLKSLAPDMIVTVDCGISAAAEIAMLVEAGIAVVVTDHHEPGDAAPVRVPVCDPKLGGAAFDGLAGAGVALKLIAAVGSRLDQPLLWRTLTDLAAIGTIGDVVPLIDENRSLVAEGLARLRRHPRPGLTALCRVAGVDPDALTAESVGFALGPRLNAAGRMADPDEALQLLLTEDPERAASLAARLDQHNTARQVAEAHLAEEADRLAETLWHEGRRSLVLAGEGWNEGVRGIVASRVVGRYGVPALIFCIQDGEARGSGRSVGDVDLHAVMGACSDLLTRFGGHAGAVGATLPAQDLGVLSERIEQELLKLPVDAFQKRPVVDAELHLWQVTRELVAGLSALEPFGSENPKPLMASRGVFMNGRSRVGRAKEHLKFEAYDGVASVPAISFRCADAEVLASSDAAVDLLYSVEADTWQGRERVQLMVKDIFAHQTSPETPAAELVDEIFSDAERILARGEYEGVTEAESFHTKLAGVSFEGRQEVVERLQSGSVLRPVRQPENRFDPNAIAVVDSTGTQVGFFNRRLAAVLAPEMDRGLQFDVTVTDVTGVAGEEKSRGVNVLVSRPDLLDAADLRAEERLARRAELAACDPDALEGELKKALIGDRPLHDAQSRALDHLAAGESCLAVMATGRGKSLIFQLHAARIALSRGEASVFVYPLRALVADQSFHLDDLFSDLGLTVRVITGETAPGRREELFEQLADGRVDVLMTTPEFLDRHAARFAASGRVRFVVIDEAHHVGLARAGHRPAYTRMGEALAVMGDPTVCAVTATADDTVASLITSTLSIDAVVLDPTRRDNLRVADRRGMSDKVAHVSSIAAGGRKIIVYVNSREQSVRVAEKLRSASPRLRSSTAFYNGGMSRAARHAVERAFRDGSITAIVATSAFGEGVNIPDVRDVALFHMPFNKVEFNQMCGRGGRDGAPATVHLLFGDRDARLNELILESTAPDLDDLRALYAALRTRSTAGDGWIDATNSELAEDVKRLRPKARLTDRGVSTGIGVFRDVGLVVSEGNGVHRRLSLSAVEGRADLTTSVRYAEGVEEVDEFGDFRTWVLSAPPQELLTAFDRPILPGS